MVAKSYISQRAHYLTSFFSLAPNIVRVLPSTCVTFLVYENTKHYLPKMWDADRLSEVE